MKRILHHIFVLSIFVVSQLAHADSSQEKTKQLGVHEHGLSELTIAIEGNVLEMQLESPAINLIGFEHKANTDKDIEIVGSTVSLLSDPHQLFSFEGDQCSLVDKSVDVSAILNANVDHDEEHEHEDEYGHEDEHEDGHEHEGENDHEHEEEHNEIVANYHYNCENIKDLSSMTVSLFQTFPNTQQIRVMWVKESKQGATTLNSKNKTVVFE